MTVKPGITAGHRFISSPPDPEPTNSPSLAASGGGHLFLRGRMKLSTNFSLAELTVTSTGLPNVPNAAEMASLKALALHVLQPLRSALGRPVLVNSGFRSEAVNRAVGGTTSSQHRLGQAADIRVTGMSSADLAREIVRLGLPFDQLIEEFGRWVHVSYGPRHRRQVLRATTENGRTVYRAWKP